LLHTTRLDHRAVQALKQEQKFRNINNLSLLDRNRLSLPLFRNHYYVLVFKLTHDVNFTSYFVFLVLHLGKHVFLLDKKGFKGAIFEF
jgi:hypothetical protein